MTDTSDGEPRRRDFLAIAAGSYVAVGAGAAMWPLIDQMNPNPATPPPEVLTVDLAPIAPGQALRVSWRGLPVFIRHRTSAEIERARNVPLGHLPDRYARHAALPGTSPAIDANRTDRAHPEWLVVIGICTHLGCVLKVSEPDVTAAADEAWFCPCHAARFDTSGRVRSGPALTNLPVPPYRFETPTRLLIG